MSEIKPVYLKDYKAPEFRCSSCELVFELFEDYTIVTNTMSLHKDNDDAKNIELDACELELLEIYLDEAILEKQKYIIKNEKLTVLNTPKNFKLKIKNKIYPQNNKELEGLYKSGDIFCTQNEPEGFRKITPYLDRPDVMSIFTTTIIADKEKYPVLLSNGNKIQCHDMFNSKHGVTWYDPHPKPSYLFALVAGDLGFISDSFITASKKRVELNIYCDKGNENRCHHAMNSLKRAMLWDEKEYAREYDLDIYNIVAVDSFNMGAMENKGLNIFNSAYVLADKDRATDENFMGIESVIAHEYFHNWTGNRITCRDWFQLTLKEGLTVFRDQCFSADMNSKDVQRIKDVKSLRERQFIEDSSPTRHPIQPNSYISMNNFYTATVYEKGAEVIRMLHTLLGKKKFRKAMDIYFEKFDGMAVTTDDFLWAMQQAADSMELTQFKRWYHQSGTPKLKVEENFQDNIFKLKLTQIIENDLDGTKQKPYYYPLKIALINTKTLKIKEEMLIVSKEEEEFVYSGFDTKPIVSLNRAFSAPIIIEQQEKNYNFLMRYDTDSFVRYEAAHSFAIDTIRDIMRGKKTDKNYLDAYSHILNSTQDPAYKALLLELPCVSAIMQKEDIVDFENICNSIDKLSFELSYKYKDKLLEIYHKNHEANSDKIDALSISKRALKNSALLLLSSLKSDEIVYLAQKQYQNASTMTDKIAALQILENISHYDASNELNEFYLKYKSDTLVMNKYFSILASSKRNGVLQRVKELQNDEAYNQEIPNLVRSLIGTFTRNYRYFHAKDGSGYSFLADKIIEIDKINPQMASGLALAFRIYKKLDKVNKNVMKKELERVVSTHSLSKNSYEIINKIL